jgi:hypothetical protein
MTQPKLTITELDGSLGILPPSAGKLLAIVGPATSGPLNTPASFAKVKDVVTTFTAGQLVEAGAHEISEYGNPVLFVRAAATVAGTYGTPVIAFTGTSVPSLDTPTPNDDYEFIWKAVVGGTIGVAGITFQWSLDKGRTYSPITALGTLTHFTVPGAGGMNILFAAGTVVAGDTVSARANGPTCNSADLATALDALGATLQSWGLCLIASPMDGTTIDTVNSKFDGFATTVKGDAWIGNFRMPNEGESEAAYKTAFDTAFSTKATTRGVLCAGASKTPSAVNGRVYRRPVSFAYAALEASVSEEVDTAAIDVGLLNVSIRDANGNADEHDESLNPGLDDSRAMVLRTWGEDAQGVYPNRPRLFSSNGSDFQLLPHRRVLNLAHRALRAYFVRRLSKPVLVDKTTGFILEHEALEIEAGAKAAMRAVLLAKPKASDVQFALSRTDNLISTKTMTGQARVVPLAYPEFINLDLGFLNPALTVTKV